MGLALVIDQLTQLPLAHVLFVGARSDMKTFAEFLKPVQKHLLQLTVQPDQLTLIFDAEFISRRNLEDDEETLCDGGPPVRPSRAARTSSRRTLRSSTGQWRQSARLADNPADRRQAARSSRCVQRQTSRRATPGPAADVVKVLARNSKMGSFAPRTDAETAKRRKTEKLQTSVVFVATLVPHTISTKGKSPRNVAPRLQYHRFDFAQRLSVEMVVELT